MTTPTATTGVPTGHTEMIPGMSGRPYHPVELRCSRHRNVAAVGLALATALACTDGRADDNLSESERGAMSAPAGADSSPERIARLVAKLSSVDNPTAEAAGDSLAKIGPAATEALIPVIEGNDRTAQFFAVKALVDYGPRAGSAVPALVRAVEQREQDSQTPSLALRALGNIGPAAGPALASLAPLLDDPQAYDHYRPLLEALARVGPAASDALPAVLRHLDPAEAALAAAGLGGPAALTALDSALFSVNGWGRNEGATGYAVALAAMGAEGHTVLTRAAKAEAPRLRQAAIVGFQSAGAEGVPGLVAILSETRPCRAEIVMTDVVACQADAAKALGEIGPPASAALPALERLLRTSSESHTQDAAKRAIAAIRR